MRFPGTDLEAARCVFEVDGTLAEQNVLHPLVLLATTAQGALTVKQDGGEDPGSVLFQNCQVAWVPGLRNRPQYHYPQVTLSEIIGD